MNPPLWLLCLALSAVLALLWSVRTLQGRVKALESACEARTQDADYLLDLLRQDRAASQALRTKHRRTIAQVRALRKRVRASVRFAMGEP